MITCFGVSRMIRLLYIDVHPHNAGSSELGITGEVNVPNSPVVTMGTSAALSALCDPLQTPSTCMGCVRSCHFVFNPWYLACLSIYPCVSCQIIKCSCVNDDSFTVTSQLRPHMVILFCFNLSQFVWMQRNVTYTSILIITDKVVLVYPPGPDVKTQMGKLAEYSFPTCV